MQDVWYGFLVLFIVAFVVTTVYKRRKLIQDRKNKETIKEHQSQPQPQSAPYQPPQWSQQTQPQPQEPVTVYCDYCMAKNDSKNKKCCSCGASMTGSGGMI